MPKYKKDINQIVELQDATAMIARCKNPRDQALIACFYLTGARPCEVIEIKKKDFTFREPTPDSFFLLLKTAKLSKVKGFVVRERLLEMPKTAPYATNLLEYASSLPTEESLLFPFSPLRARQLIYEASENRFCPYHFRHSRLTKLSRAGATTDELMYWKGARDIKSVSEYLKNKPIGKRLEIE